MPIISSSGNGNTKSDRLNGLYRVSKVISTSTHKDLLKNGYLLAAEPSYRYELLNLKRCYLLKKDDEVERLKNELQTLRTEYDALRLKDNERKKQLHELLLQMADAKAKLRVAMTLDDFISFLQLGFFATLWFSALLLSRNEESHSDPSNY
ncbi:hypothetical protein FDP41_001743 [Naegleria fowleri]|uniref:Uncharacterized protein n=1 Tax=Naegleria fowleri TaxID=5763 RepID=A0A6A5C0M0_NAEFO|nr:uncharacterized protein FDP41_001743 [Naegleria fowleri]KAF0979400.1 hypothetical protein FDP41_001743 [Naegleria fowleri]CAG4708777.1 unnamed protein product [Naegleria fowleri]